MDANYPHEIKWVMTGNIRHLESGTVYGDCAMVYVDGEERFVVGIMDKYDRTIHVTVFTRYTNTGIQVASFHMLPGNMHANLTELAQVLAPLHSDAAFVPPF